MEHRQNSTKVRRMSYWLGYSMSSARTQSGQAPCPGSSNLNYTPGVEMQDVGSGTLHRRPAEQLTGQGSMFPERTVAQPRLQLGSSTQQRSRREFHCRLGNNDQLDRVTQNLHPLRKTNLRCKQLKMQKRVGSKSSQGIGSVRKRPVDNNTPQSKHYKTPHQIEIYKYQLYTPYMRKLRYSYCKHQQDIPSKMKYLQPRKNQQYIQRKQKESTRFQVDTPRRMRSKDHQMKYKTRE